MPSAPAVPFGQLPILEVDGVVIPQSLAQLRYVGKIGGLYPTDPMEAAFCDAAADTFTDVYRPMRNSYDEKDEAKKVMQKWCKKQNEGSLKMKTLRPVHPT